MKKIHFFLAGLLCLSALNANSQTIIAQENFETSFTSDGAVSNTTGLWRSSAAGVNNQNNWGAHSTGTYPIQGRSLMIAAAQGGVHYPGQYFNNVTTNKYVYATVDATGYQNITLEFQWRCYGDLDNGTLYDYGMVTYSTSTTGTSFTDITTGGTYGNGRYGAGNQNVHTSTVTLPVGVNNKSFRIGFRWINDNSIGFSPGFVIDNIIIRGTSLSSDRTLTVSEAYTGATRANGNHTIANNTSVTATSGTRTGYNVTGWIGTGSVPATGTGGSTTFTITQNSTITWNWQQIGLPNNLTFYNTGGSEQLTFNNSRINTSTPIFRLSHTTDPASDYQVEINTNPTFSGGTNWTQTFTGTYPTNTQTNFSFTNGFTPSSGTTYYVRARARGAANTWSNWTTETYSFTHDSSVVVPNWFQTTQAQLATATLSGLQANTNGDIIPASGGGNVITNGSFEGGSISGWTITRPGTWYTVASEAYGNTVGTNALNIYNNNPGSFGYFNGDAAGAYQSVNLTGVSTITYDVGYEATSGSSLNVQCRVYISETSQTGATAGTLVDTWTPPSAESMGNSRTINISSFGYTGNKLLKFIFYIGLQETNTNERYLYIDNVQTVSLPQGTATSTPITLASVQTATKYNTIKWNQTLNGGSASLKVQQYNGSSWVDVSGYSNITATGDGEKTFDISAMTAYPQIRLAASLSGSATVTLHDWSVIFENPCTAEITSVTNGSGCADITLTAVGSAGTTTYNWYDAITGGNLVHTSSTGEWIVSGLTSATTYYVAANNGTCESTRVAITATPTLTSASILFTQGASLCSPGSPTLYAETNDDNLYTVKWFDTLTGGTALHTGFTYSPTVTQTTTFYVAAVDGDCESERTDVTIAVNAKTWNGSQSTAWSDAANWTPTGVPTSEDCVTIPQVTNSPIITNGTEAHAKSLTLEENSSLLVQTGGSITVVQNVVLAENAGETVASFTLENDAYLKQTQNTATNNNIGKITVHRNSTPMFRLEATGWSSPVIEQKLYDFAIGTYLGRIYEYDESSNSFVNSGITTATTFEGGKGYSIRAPNTYPSYSVVNTPTPVTFNGVFYGKPNNGDVNINITTNNLGFNYVGNPYPSPIDAYTLLDNNQTIDALYFWTHEAPPIDGTYTANNYASFNNVGGTVAAAGGEEPDGIIQVGQGFVARTSTSTSLQFTNDLRESSSNGQFFRQANNTDERHRMWLNLSNSETNFNQILIGYIPNATMGKDHQIDAKMFSYSGSSIYSLIDNDKFVIQGRSMPFNTNDIVPVGFRATETGMYTIAIDHVDGLFSEGQTIYLNDLFLNRTHNLTEGSYNFLSDTGTFNNRFEVVYNADALSVSNPEINNNNWIVYKNENQIHIKSNGFEIKNVEIYDLTGRLLMNKQNINSETFSCPANFAQQVLLVKVNNTLVKKVL